MSLVRICPFCQREPSIEMHRIVCCGVAVTGHTSVGTKRRWNEIARSVNSRRTKMARDRFYQRHADELAARIAKP